MDEYLPICGLPIPQKHKENVNVEPNTFIISFYFLNFK